VTHWIVSRASGSLFDSAVPDGFEYRDDFLTPEEEAALLDAIAQVEFSTFEMRGIVARRRVKFYGRTYDSSLPATPQFPEFLLHLREKVGAWMGLDPQAFAMALINEYQPSAPIGWHRDAPQYDIVAGVSLLSPCRMKLRPYVSPGAASTSTGRRIATHEITLQPRSAYSMTGDARTRYEHHIPPVSALRYSITFRTLRSG
jgi:alkylated DNA repair dioxygenase AlkB